LNPAVKSALLFLVFNRPEPTRRTFQALRAARPPRLFISADGARAHKDGEAERCAEVREIVDQVDWPCEVRHLYREQNLGCRRAVSGAISWFFEHEEEGIILEDDCLPEPDFFRFCDVALETWRNEPRVMHVGGHVLVNGPGPEDLLFSRLVPIWGWATWRRAWRLYDSEMTRLPLLAAIPLRDWYGAQQGQVRKAIEHIHHANVDAWGARWVLTVMTYDGLSVLPRVNLISNIGFGAEATHTTVDSHLANLPTAPLPAQLKLPVALRAHRAYDKRYLAIMNDPWARAQRVLRRLRLRLGL
jgi:hypothetical protein